PTRARVARLADFREGASHSLVQQVRLCIGCKRQQRGGFAQVGPDVLERMVYQFTALAVVESRHRPLEALATQPRLRETAKGAARLGFERRYAARALAGAERRREFIRESLQRRCGVHECAPV